MAPGPAFDKASRKLLVVFATKRGLELGAGVPKGVLELDTGAVTGQKAVEAILLGGGGRKTCIPFSAGLIVGEAPGALGTENLAKLTGLNDAGFFGRVPILPSVRLASDSEPPSEAVSSPASDPDATPFISSARVATGPGLCFDISYTKLSIKTTRVERSTKTHSRRLPIGPSRFIPFRRRFGVRLALVVWRVDRNLGLRC